MNSNLSDEEILAMIQETYNEFLKGRSAATVQMVGKLDQMLRVHGEDFVIVFAIGKFHFASTYHTMKYAEEENEN